MDRVELLTQDVNRLIPRSAPLGYDYAYVVIRNRMLAYLESAQLQHTDFCVTFVPCRHPEIVASAEGQSEIAKNLQNAIAMGII